MASFTSCLRIVLLIALGCVLAEPTPVPPASLGEVKGSRQDLETAAAGGEAEAQFQLAMMERRAKDSTEGLKRALPWFRKAGRQGHVQAQYELGVAYLDGWGEGHNHPLAAKWLTRAAGKGHARAWLVLGNLYAEGGPGVLQDAARARECYRKANEKRDGEVWFALGGVYHRGRGGVAADWPLAFEHYLKAADKGHQEAQYTVGQFYQYGIGTPVKLSRALSWYRRAAQQGDHWAAEVKLGWLYEHGIGIARDRRQALAWYKKAEQHGWSCWGHLVRLGDPQTLKSRQTAPEPDPATKDIEITLEPDKSKCDLDDLVVIALRYRNVGKETYSFTECHTGGFHSPFSVKDEKGRELPNPFAEERLGLHVGSSMMSTHILEPGQTEVVRKTLNQCVHFEKPGTYTISTWGWVYRGKGGQFGDRTAGRAVEVKPITLTVRRGDPAKRQRDIDCLVKAYRGDRGYPDGLVQPAEQFGRPDVLRRLVFYNDPKLLNLFLDALEEDEARDFAETGLRALPDRAAVLKALEQRLDHPEKYRTLELLYPYLRLAGLLDQEGWFDEGEPGRLNNWWREQEISRKVRDKALQLLRRDRGYQYGHLVPGLLGGSDDLFLIDYLIRCRPNLDLVRKCALTLQKVRLTREHIPFLKSLLAVPRDWNITDAAILQLVRLEGPRYLAELKANRGNFSPEIVKLLLGPVQE